ncbi:hypothetical protein C0J52_27262 [Blattella germanica]|nr:hypothetical protein C0J52_27262 [Blattella germanica]
MTDQGGEGILEEIGGFGTYQKLLCVLVVGAVNGVSAMSFAAQLFSLLTPEHWCWDPKLASLEEQLPLSQEQGKKFSLPVESTRESLFIYL